MKPFSPYSPQSKDMPAICIFTLNSLVALPSHWMSRNGVVPLKNETFFFLIYGVTSMIPLILSLIRTFCQCRIFRIYNICMNDNFFLWKSHPTLVINFNVAGHMNCSHIQSLISICRHSALTFWQAYVYFFFVSTFTISV